MPVGDIIIEAWIGSVGPLIVREGDNYPGTAVAAQGFRMKLLPSGGVFYLGDSGSGEFETSLILQQLLDVQDPDDDDLLRFDLGTATWEVKSLKEMAVPIVVGAAVTNNIPKFNADDDIVDSGIATAEVMTEPPSAVAGNLAEFTAGKQVVDSGVDPANLCRRPGSHTTNNVAKLDAQGDPEDLGIALGDLLQYSSDSSGAPTVDHKLIVTVDGVGTFELGCDKTA